MNRFNPTLAFVVLCCGFGSAALAQDKSMATTSDKPHATATKSTKPMVKASVRHKTQAGKSEVRDWRAIDTNHDNLIEPDEMEAYLKHKAS